MKEIHGNFNRIRDKSIHAPIYCGLVFAAVSGYNSFIIPVMKNLILVAEDDEDLCRLLKLYISQKGFNVVCLQSLTEAENYLQKVNPRLSFSTTISMMGSRWITLTGLSLALREYPWCS